MSLVYSPPVDAATLSPAELSRALHLTLDAALPLLRAFSDAETQMSSVTGKWSVKQILGHLIDSAANNLQRFVRLQIEPELRLPGYQQEEWVAVQQYDKRAWTELVSLWETLNLHLVHVMKHTAREHLSRLWVREDESLTLGFIMQDYTAHMQHHLRQLIPAHRGLFTAR